MIVLLSQGGIGNQLFQYSALQYLHFISSKRPRIDPYSFHGNNDKLYGRLFSLSEFTSDLLLSPITSFLIKVIYKFIVIFFYESFTKKSFLSGLLGLLILNDKNFHGCSELVRTHRFIILHGYFQFPEIPFYLKLHSPKIYEKIFKYRTAFLSNFNITRHSLAICFRAYEETSSPTQHFTHFGSLAENHLLYFAEAVVRILKALSSSNVWYSYIFTTSEFSKQFLKDCLIIHNYRILDEVFISSPSDFQELILISGFSHIALNQSTFYWWASFLSLGPTNSNFPKIYFPYDFMPSPSYPSDNYFPLCF